MFCSAGRVATPTLLSTVPQPSSMYRLNLTLPTAAENLALDEALLDAAEAGEVEGEVLRVWESAAACVVVGSSSRVANEVHLDHCYARNIPVLRRCSGGAAIVAGPGCLMYSLVLDLQQRPYARAVDQAHRFVLGRLVGALRPLALHVSCRGTSDLALGDRKFSGNSLRMRRERLLYHGTLLYAFDLDLATACLMTPPRMPEYRQGRTHAAFLTNLPLGRDQIAKLLCQAWSAQDELENWPHARTETLVQTKYSQPAWNLRY